MLGQAPEAVNTIDVRAVFLPGSSNKGVGI